MFRYVVMLVLMLVATAGMAEEDAQAKTVLGPRNIYLSDGADALIARDSERGVSLTLKGLRLAQGLREEKIAHANLCAGFMMLDQPDTALEHCNWVLENDPFHWRTYNNRALVYIRLKRFEESEADIRRGQELNPKSENLKEVKGILLDEVEPVEEKIVIDDRRNQPQSPPEQSE